MRSRASCRLKRFFTFFNHPAFLVPAFLLVCRAVSMPLLRIMADERTPVCVRFPASTATWDAAVVRAAASTLGDDMIHVWQLSYARDAGRAPLLALLSAYRDPAANAPTLLDGEHGRPRLAPEQFAQPDFNWSHSGRIALIAVGRGISPGIDVERRRPRPHALELALRYFSAEEAQMLSALDAELREDAFLRLWTAKEAVLKAVGRGLAFGLDRLNVAITPSSLRLRHLDGDDATAWQLQPLVLDADHVAALAWRGAPRRVVFHQLAACSDEATAPCVAI